MNKNQKKDLGKLREEKYNQIVAEKKGKLTTGQKKEIQHLTKATKELHEILSDVTVSNQQHPFGFS